MDIHFEKIMVFYFFREPQDAGSETEAVPDEANCYITHLLTYTDSDHYNRPLRIRAGYNCN